MNLNVVLIFPWASHLISLSSIVSVGGVFPLEKKYMYAPGT